MSAVDPFVVASRAVVAVSPPAVPVGCPGRLREVSRLEWWCGQPGDPSVLLEEFLAGYDLPVGDLSRQRPRSAAGSDAVCGAAVLISAAAGTVMAGAVMAGTVMTRVDQRQPSVRMALRRSACPAANTAKADAANRGRNVRLPAKTSSSMATNQAACRVTIQR